MTLCGNFTHFSPPPSRPTSINGYQWAFREIDELQGGEVLSVTWISPSPRGGGNGGNTPSLFTFLKPG